MEELAGTRRVRIVQVAWLLVALTSMAVFVASLLTGNGHAFSSAAEAVFAATGYAVFWVIWFGLAALIIWRKPRDRGAILCAFFLVTFPLLNPSGASGFLPFIQNTVPFVALILFGLLFPDGHFAPRWMRWVAAVGIIATIASALLPNSIIFVIPVLFLPLTIVGVQIYRFRRISTWAQRQQTKWAMFGLLVALLGFVAVILLILIDPGVGQHPLKNLGGGTVDFSGVLPYALISIIPICIGIAVFRSRLWDIDRVISRALAYTALTAILAGIYIGSVIGLQALFRAISGQQSELAVAISTLVIAALFNPLRHRIQNFIARTFSRRKYNAQLVLATFGATCRDETNLDTLRDSMVRVVEETVQPAHVSLWLREIQRDA